MTYDGEREGHCFGPDGIERLREPEAKARASIGKPHHLYSTRNAQILREASLLTGDGVGALQFTV